MLEIPPQKVLIGLFEWDTEVNLGNPHLGDQGSPRQIRLNHVGPVQAVQTVGPKYSLLSGLHHIPVLVVEDVEEDQVLDLLHKLVDSAVFLAPAYGMEVKVSVVNRIRLFPHELAEHRSSVARQQRLVALLPTQQVQDGHVAVFVQHPGHMQ